MTAESNDARSMTCSKDGASQLESHVDVSPGYAMEGASNTCKSLAAAGGGGDDDDDDDDEEEVEGAVHRRTKSSPGCFGAELASL